MKAQKINMIASVFLVGLFPFLGDCRPHAHRRDFPKHVLNRLDDRVEKLNLTATQQDKYKLLRARIEQDLKMRQEMRKEAMTHFNNEMKKENPNIEEAIKYLKDKMAEHPSMREKGLDYFKEFYAMLDDKQKKELQKRFAKRLDHWTFH